MRNHTIAAVLTGILLACASGAQAQESAIKQFGKDLGAGVVQGLQGNLLPAADKDFLLNASSGGIAEVEMARIALERSESPAIKRHAREMITDHTQANDELRRLANSKGVTLPDAPNVSHRAMVDRVKNAPASEFDRTYLRVAGVNAHEEMRTLFRNHSSSAVDPDVRAFAAKTLPTVEAHLKHSERMQQDMRVSQR